MRVVRLSLLATLFLALPLLATPLAVADDAAPTPSAAPDASVAAPAPAPDGAPGPLPVLIKACVAEPEPVCGQACWDAWMACESQPGCWGACLTACASAYFTCSCDCPPAGE